MEVITTYKNLTKRVHKKYCDNCKVELVGGFAYYLSPKYGYNCPKCGEVYTFDKVYPWVEIIGEEEDE